MRFFYLLLFAWFLKIISIGQNDFCYKNLNPIDTYTFTFSGLPESKVIADVNQDGYLDIVTGDASPNGVSIYYGNSLAKYSNPLNLPAIYTPRSVKVKDLNGDSIKDIILSEGFLANGRVGIALGMVTGGFGAIYYLPFTPYSPTGNIVDVRDYDHDGNQDLLLITQSAEILFVGGKGNGSFFNPYPIATATNYYDKIIVNDFNNDNNLDLLVSSIWNSANGAIKIYLGTNQNYYRMNVPTTYTITNSGTTPEILVDDFNNDGFSDMVIAGSAGITTFTNNASGVLGLKGAITTYSNANQVKSGDFNNDGNKDIVVMYPYGILRLLLGDGIGGFLVHHKMPTPYGGDIVIKDINGDGFQDIRLLNGAGWGVLINDNQMNFRQYAYRIPTVISGMNEYYRDFDRDGFEDILASTSSGFGIIKGTSDTTFYGIKNYPLSGYGNTNGGVAIGDMNQDGNNDIVVSNADSLYNVSVFYTNSQGEYGQPVVYKRTLPSTYINLDPIIGNFNQDNYLDIFTNEVIYLGGAGGVTTQTIGTNLNSKIIGSGDMNNDGKMDLIFNYGISNSIGVFFNNGAGVFTAGVLQTSGINPVKAEVTDLNNDTYKDLIVLNDGEQVKVMLGTSNVNVFSSVTNYTTGINPNAVKTADFNGDGKLDVAISNFASDNVTILLGDGTGALTFSNNVNIGPRPQGLTVGDFNSDGLVDLLVKTTYIKSELLFFKGNGNGTFTYINRTNYNGESTILGVDLNLDSTPEIISASNAVMQVIYSGTPNITISSSTNSICTGASVALSAAGISSYTWSTGQTTPAIVASPSVTTTYSVLGRDNFGCSSTSSITINVSNNIAPILSISGNTNVCSGDATTLTVLGASSYTWSNGATGNTANYSPVTNSTIVVQGEDTNGCINTATTTITTMSKPSLGLTGTAPLCSGKSTSLTINSTGVNTYSWSTSATTSSIAVSPAFTTTYSAMVTGTNTCARSATLSLTVNQTPTVTISGPSLLCPNVVGTLTATGADTYTWSSPSMGTSSTATVLPASSSVNYWATGMAANGCTVTSIKNVSVTPGSSANISNYPNAVCSNTVVTFILNNCPSCSSYNWNTGVNTYSTQVNTLTAGSNVSLSISYANQYGCQETKNASFSVYPTPTLTVVSPTAVCSANSATLSVTGAYTYTWNSAITGSSLVVTPTVTSTYTVTGKSTNACYKTDFVNVQVNYAPNVSILPVNGFCTGNSTALTASGAPNFLWSTGETLSTISVSPTITQNYTVTGTSPCGSSTKTINVIVFQNPTVTVNSGAICSGQSFTMIPNGANAYTYSGGSDVVSPSANTIYSVSGTDANGCVSSVDAVSNVTVNALPSITVNSGTICSGQSFTVIPSGASTYTFSGGSDIVSPATDASYSVSGTDVNGCISSVDAVSNVMVNALPVISAVSSSSSVCLGTSATMTVSGATTYTWSTGTIATTETVSPPVSSTYSVTGTDVNNCSTTQTVSVTVANSCADVWPGDANSDGIADNLDVLELGLHYMQTGAPRALTSNNWQSYFANNWVGTITNGKNLNHSDCNGDGTINDDDTLAIYTNYGLSHAFKTAQTTTVNPQLSIVPDQSAVVKGTWGSASVYLGDATNTINNINGLAFTVDFDNALIETNSIYVEYQNSFIDASQNLHFRKLNFANGKIFTATTHTVNNNVSGFGKIATLHYQISSSLTTDQSMTIGVSQVNQSDASGLITPITSGSGTLMAVGSSVGITEVLNSDNVSISPNPTNGVLNITFSTIPQNTKIEIYNSIGALVLTEVVNNKHNTINTTALSNGMYLIKVLENNRITTVQKIVKQ